MFFTKEDSSLVYIIVLIGSMYPIAYSLTESNFVSFICVVAYTVLLASLENVSKKISEYLSIIVATIAIGAWGVKGMPYCIIGIGIFLLNIQRIDWEREEKWTFKSYHPDPIEYLRWKTEKDIP